MAELFCAMCKQTRDEKEFTVFTRNPSLKDRNGRVVMCKNCCSKMVEEQGNTKDALKNILRLVDIPYLENFANSALETFKKKRKGTNLVIKKNVYGENKETAKIETTNSPNTIYTCYSARLGLMPKKYVDFSYSDGIRNDASGTHTVEVKEDESDDKKAIQSSMRYLKKMFTEEIYEDKDRLSQAVELKMQELSLHKNNTNARQNKFKLKNHVLTLIDATILSKDNYQFIFAEDGEQKPKDIMIVNVDSKDEEYKLPDGMSLERLQERWGDEYKTKELVKFERKYLELRKNYEIKTASHDEFLRHACIASIKANDCMARNDADGSKVWFGIFKDMTSAGKLQPSQMSKADLSGGLNSFSEFFKTVEQSRSVIDILPTMYETPRDKADLVVYCLVQYVRRLKGLQDVEYKDIYKFYEEMESQFVGDGDDMDFDSFFSDEEGDIL